VKVINTSKNTLLADNVKRADTFLSRLVGLLNRSSLNKGEALVLTPSNSIHSFFMRFTIDAIFIDKDGKIVKALPSLKPFRFSLPCFNSYSVIELPENTLKLTRTQVGDIVKIS